MCDYVIEVPGWDSANALSEAILIWFWVIFSLLVCACLCIMLNLLQRLAANLLTGWDVDRDGKLELQEILYAPLDDLLDDLYDDPFDGPP